MYFFLRKYFTEALSSNNRGDTHKDTQTEGRNLFMDYSTETDSNVVIYILSFIKTG
jgi:hypothetical protein